MTPSKVIEKVIFVLANSLLIRLSHLSGTRIAQSVVCRACCPAWCSVAGSTLLWFSSRGDFFLGVNMGSDSIPSKNSFRWEYKLTSSLCTYAFHCMDSNDPDIHVLDGWMLTTKKHTQHAPSTKMVATTSMVGLKKKKKKKGHNRDNLAKNGEPWDIAKNAEEEEAPLVSQPCCWQSHHHHHHGGPSVSRMTLCLYLWVWEWLCRPILDLQSRAQSGHWKFAAVAGIEAAKWRCSLADCAWYLNRPHCFHCYLPYFIQT